MADRIKGFSYCDAPDDDPWEQRDDPSLRSGKATLEVYLTLEYGPKHSDELEKFRTCAKLATDDFTDTEVQLRVANWLRDKADEIDPLARCANCGKQRYQHAKQDRIYRCYNKYGPLPDFDSMAYERAEAAR